MGDPIRIDDLAKDLIRLSGLEPGRDIDIVYSGLLPGEKLYEELFAEQEAYIRTHHDKIFMCRDGNCVPSGHNETLDQTVEGLLAAARKGDEQGARRLLGDLAPGFPLATPSSGDSTSLDARLQRPVQARP
jgi:FlaA1/EpsC-like NDP-sugar epimerase